MDVAKTSFLKNLVKEEVPPHFVEMDCDGFKCDDDAAVLKGLEEVVVKLEMDPMPIEISVDENASVLQHDADSAANNCNASSDEDENGQSSDNESTLISTATLPAAAAAKHVAANETNAKIMNLPPKKSSETVGDHLESLVPNSMDMLCEICQHPFESLTAANHHYRNTHNQRAIVVKCCQKRIDLYDMLEHIQYHLNPDIFR